METLLKRCDSELYKILVTEHEVPAQVFLLRWVRLLFLREFALADTIELWSHIFQDGFLSMNLVSGSMSDESGTVVLSGVDGVPCFLVKDTVVKASDSNGSFENFFSLGDYFAIAMMVFRIEFWFFKIVFSARCFVGHFSVELAIHQVVFRLS